MMNEEPEIDFFLSVTPPDWSATRGAKVYDLKLHSSVQNIRAEHTGRGESFLCNGFQKAKEEVDDAAQANYVTRKMIAKAGEAPTAARFLPSFWDSAHSVWGRCFE